MQYNLVIRINIVHKKCPPLPHTLRTMQENGRLIPAPQDKQLPVTITIKNKTSSVQPLMVNCTQHSHVIDLFEHVFGVNK